MNFFPDQRRGAVIGDPRFEIVFRESMTRERWVSMLSISHQFIRSGIQTERAGTIRSLLSRATPASHTRLELRLADIRRSSHLWELWKILRGSRVRSAS